MIPSPAILAWSDAAVLGGLAALVVLGLAFLLRPEGRRAPRSD